MRNAKCAMSILRSAFSLSLAWVAVLLAGCGPGDAGTPPVSIAGPSPSTQPGPIPERIVFCGNRTGQWRIWQIDPDGSNLTRLTDGTPGDEDSQDVDPAISPDGQSILFTSTRLSAGGKAALAGVWRMTASTGQSGKSLARICDGDQAEWSPDGLRIVLRRNEGIVIRELASGRERIITPPDFPHCSGPAWSPDGRTIAFACRWDAGNGLYTVSVEGGQAAPVKVYDRQGACEPHFSPSGDRLVYETETNICAINPDGTRNRMVTYYGGVQRYARFAPDGKRIVFCQAASPAGPWELYIVSSAGGEGSPTRLTTSVSRTGAAADGGEETSSDMYPDWR